MLGKALKTEPCPLWLFPGYFKFIQENAMWSGNAGGRWTARGGDCRSVLNKVSQSLPHLSRHGREPGSARTEMCATKFCSSDIKQRN